MKMISGMSEMRNISENTLGASMHLLGDAAMMVLKYVKKSRK
jgi:hypothetical protein